MDLINGERDSRVLEAELRAEVRPADAVWPNAPRSEAFQPLVLMLVVFLPWIYLAAHAQMDAPLAAAGLQALDFLSGPDADLSPAGRPSSPLPTWVEAVALSLPSHDKPLASAAPAAFFGVLSGLLLFRLGSVWFSPAVGVLAAMLLICNRTLLEEIRAGSPGPLVLFLTLAALWPLAEHLRRQDEGLSRWIFLGSLAVAGLLLSAGVYAGCLASLGLGAMALHGGDDDDSWRKRLRKAATDPTMRVGVFSLVLGALFAAPWLARLPWSWQAWLSRGAIALQSSQAFDWRDAAATAPVLGVLGIFGLGRAVHGFVRDSGNSARNVLPALWGLLAALVFSFLSPTRAAFLVLTAPMILLAAQVLLDVAARGMKDHLVLQAAAATGVAAIAGADLPIGENSRPVVWTVKIAACLALLVGLTFLYRWSRDSDVRRRWLFGAFVLAAIAAACAPGLMLLRARPRSNDPWRQVHQRLAQLIRNERPDVVVFLAAQPEASPSNSARVILEFLIRAEVPQQERMFVGGIDELERRLVGFARPLVIVPPGAQRPPKIFSIAHGGRVLTLVERLDTDLVTIYTPLAPPNH